MFNSKDSMPPLSTLQRNRFVVMVALGATMTAATAQAQPASPEPSTGASQGAEDGKRANAAHEGSPVALPAPVIRQILPVPKDDQLTLKLGKPAIVVIDVDSPAGDPVIVEVAGLPQGAVFDSGTLTLRWTPTPAQVGAHPLRIVARAGGREASRLLQLQVVPNRAPVIEPGQLYLHTRGVAMPEVNRIIVTDADGDPVLVTVQGLPRGIVYQPTTGQVLPVSDEIEEGTYPVVVRASDGEIETVRTIALTIEPRVSRRGRGWESYLVPGVGYGVQSTSDDERLGYLAGPWLEVVVAAWIHANENRGPSHGRVYLKAEFLTPSGDSTSLGLAYGAGFDLSLERNPHREWLIPHYGVELGGLTQAEIEHSFQVTPYAGVHLWSSRNLFVQIRGGYRVVPKDLDRLNGWHGGGVVDFSIW